MPQMLTCTVTSKVSSPRHGSATGAGANALHTPLPLPPPFTAAAAVPGAVEGAAGCAGAAASILLLATVEAGSCTRCVGPADGFTLMGGSAGGFACSGNEMRFQHAQPK